MSGDRGWFVRVLAVTVLSQAAVYGLRPMVSYQAIALGADNTQLGVVAAAFASLSLLVAVPIGRWIDRRGEARFVFLGAALIAGVALWLLIIDDLVSLTISQALLGFGHIATVVGTQAMVANHGDPAKRDARFGAFTVIVSLGQLTGPALAGLVADSGDSGAFDGTAVFGTAAVATALSVVVAGWAWLVEKPVRRGGRGADSMDVGILAAGRRVLSIPSMPKAMVASLTVLTTIDLLAVYLPAYGEAHGLPVSTVGLLLAVRAGASMASRLFMLRLIRLLGRKRLLLVSIVAPAVVLTGLPLTTQVVALVAIMVVAGLGLGLGQPVTLAWVADRAPRELRGTALGVRLTGNRLGQVVLPLLAGLVTGGGGVSLAFVFMGVTLATSAATVSTAEFGADPD